MSTASLLALILLPSRASSPPHPITHARRLHEEAETPQRTGPFELAFTVYYAPLFGVIALMNAALKRMPEMPDAFFQGIGVTLTMAGGSWLTPVALIGLARKASSNAQR